MKNRLAPLWIALTTYSRIPCPQAEFSDENRRFSLCFFPVIGIVIGALTAGWFCLCDCFAFGTFLKGVAACMIPACVSGGIHLDGMMDTMDALASHQSREKCLEILKDSHTGAFAVIGLALYMMLDAALLGEIADARCIFPLALVFCLSRALSAVNLLTLPSARSGGMADGFIQAADRKKVLTVLWTETALFFLAMLLTGGLSGLIAAAAGSLYTVWLRRMAVRRFGGITGDLAGFFLEGFELACTAGIVLAQVIL